MCLLSYMPAEFCTMRHSAVYHKKYLGHPFLHVFLYGYQYCPCDQNTYTHIKQVTSVAVDDSHAHRLGTFCMTVHTLCDTVFLQWTLTQIERHRHTEKQLYCAVSGVLYVYSVTLLQATPDRFQCTACGSARV
jgi:hypothetical protein